MPRPTGRRSIRSPGFLLAAVLWIAPSGGFGQAASRATPPPSANPEAERWREDLRFMASEMPRRHRIGFRALPLGLYLVHDGLFVRAARERADAVRALRALRGGPVKPP